MSYFRWENGPSSRSFATFDNYSWTPEPVPKKVPEKSFTRRAINMLNPFRRRGKKQARPEKLSSESGPTQVSNGTASADMNEDDPFVAKDSSRKASTLSKRFSTLSLRRQTSKPVLRSAKSWMSTLHSKSDREAPERQRAFSQLSSMSKYNVDTTKEVKSGSTTRRRAGVNNASPVRIPGRNYIDSGVVREATGQCSYFSKKSTQNLWDYIYSAPKPSNPLKDMMRAEKCLRNHSTSPAPSHSSPQTPPRQVLSPSGEVVFPWVDDPQCPFASPSGKGKAKTVPRGPPVVVKSSGVLVSDMARPKELFSVTNPRASTTASSATAVDDTDRVLYAVYDILKNDIDLDSSVTASDPSISSATPSIHELPAEVSNARVDPASDHDGNQQEHVIVETFGAVGAARFHERFSSETRQVQSAASTRHLGSEDMKNTGVETRFSGPALIQQDKEETAKMLSKISTISPAPGVNSELRVTESALLDESEVSTEEVERIISHYPEIGLAFSRPCTPRPLVFPTSSSITNVETSPVNMALDDEDSIGKHVSRSRTPAMSILQEWTDSIRSRGRSTFRDYRERSPFPKRIRTPVTNDSYSDESPASQVVVHHLVKDDLNTVPQARKSCSVD